LQLPLQVSSQQTFVDAPEAVTAQWPLPHSVSDAHESPLERAMQTPLTHAGAFSVQSLSPQHSELRTQRLVPGH
jgi:hypothetical protein